MLRHELGILVADGSIDVDFAHSALDGFQEQFIRDRMRPMKRDRHGVTNTSSNRFQSKMAVVSTRGVASHFIRRIGLDPTTS